MGRKPKYDYTDRDFLLVVEGFARDGWDDKQIAKYYNIKPETFCRLKDKYNQLSQSLKRGRLPLDIHVENSLYKRAIGLKTKSITRQWVEDEEGEQKGAIRVVETETEYPPDTGAACAWLKQRKPERWNKQPTKLDITSNDETISLPTIIITPRIKPE